MGGVQNFEALVQNLAQNLVQNFRLRSNISPLWSILFTEMFLLVVHFLGILFRDFQGFSDIFKDFQRFSGQVFFVILKVFCPLPPLFALSIFMPSEMFRGFQRFSEVFRDFQRFSDLKKSRQIFRDFQGFSEIFRDFQSFSEIFRKFS